MHSIKNMKKPESICIFGDSVEWGAWDMERGGWVNRLWLDVAKRKENYVEIYNLSVSGGTSETILERFQNEAKIRNADALLFQTGGNDSAYENAPDNFLVGPEKFKNNLTEIIKRAREITEKIAFVTLANCDESKTMPVSWVNIYYVNENIKKYNEIIERACLENNIPLLHTKPLNNEDFDDGLHPNAKGHQKIFEEVKSFLVINGWV